jgi:hypothetical protein
MILPLAEPGQVVEISLEALLPVGQVVVKGISLVHQPTNTSRSVLLSTEGLYRQVHSGDVKIYENLAVLPRAFVVHQAEVVADAAQALTRLRSPEFDPAQRLVRFQQGSEALGVIERGQASPLDRAEIVVYEPEMVEIEVALESPGWLVLSDTNYPGWQATVDDQAVAIVPANLMFRAVPLLAGEHTVRFEFRPHSLQIGGWLSGLALLGLLAGLVLSRRPNR